MYSNAPIHAIADAMTVILSHNGSIESKSLRKISCRLSKDTKGIIIIIVFYYQYLSSSVPYRDNVRSISFDFLALI